MDLCLVGLVTFWRWLCTCGGSSCPASQRPERAFCAFRYRTDGTALRVPNPESSVGGVEYGRPQHAPDIIALAASGADVSVGLPSQCTFRNDQRKTGLPRRACFYAPVGGPAPFPSA